MHRSFIREVESYLLLPTLLASLMRIDLSMGELTRRATSRAVTAGLASLLASLMWVNFALSEL